MDPDPLPPCAVTGCVALATHGLFCVVHDPQRPPAPTPKMRQLPALVRIAADLRQRHPRVLHLVEQIHEQAIPCQILTVYRPTGGRSFTATILVSPDVTEEAELAFLLMHQVVHVAQHWRRCHRAGSWWCHEIDLSSPDALFFSWEEVRQSAVDAELQDAERLATGREYFLSFASRCPVCASKPEELAWMYCSASPWAWQQRAGKSGWLSLCGRCHRQVNFFVEAQN